VNGKQVRHWDLQYSYVTGRLTLDKIIEQVGGVAKPPYQFSYGGSLPPTNSNVSISTQLDHWGFLNDNTYPSLIPATTMITALREEPLDLPGADRSPSPSGVLAGMLQQITYPTGGRDMFTFEPHQYSFEQNAEVIKKEIIPREINLSTTLNNLTDSKTFVLNDWTDLLKLDIHFEYNIVDENGDPLPNGGVDRPSVTVSDSNGKPFFILSLAVTQQDLLEPRYFKHMVPPGTYTITATGKKRNMTINNGDGTFSTVTRTNLASVTLMWDEDTGRTYIDSVQGGGVRVAKIVRSYGNGSPDKTSIYKYDMVEDGVTKSSGLCWNLTLFMKRRAR